MYYILLTGRTGLNRRLEKNQKSPGLVLHFRTTYGVLRIGKGSFRKDLEVLAEFLLLS